MHRIKTVRKQQGVTVRSAARQMEIDVRRVRGEEDAWSDLRLSTMYRWQKMLEVPLIDLVVETNEPLSRPVMERARMIKLMKTAVTILERTPTVAVRRLTQMLISQLVEIMPETEGIGPWQSVGQQRTLNELGRIVERRLPDDFFMTGC